MIASLEAARKIRKAVYDSLKQSAEVAAPPEEPVLPHSVLRGTRGYLEKVVFQVNSTYLAGAYDACAVMVRRLIEILIIEVHEARGEGTLIKDKEGNYLQLGELVAAALRATDWNLSRNTKRSLGKLKDIGDLSAHSRRYNAKRPYIDELATDIRVAVEELAYLAKLK